MTAAWVALAVWLSPSVLLVAWIAACEARRVAARRREFPRPYVVGIAQASAKAGAR